MFTLHIIQPHWSMMTGNMTDGLLPDAAALALSLVRILESRIADDDVSQYAGLHPGFAPHRHPVKTPWKLGSDGALVLGISELHFFVL